MTHACVSFDRVDTHESTLVAIAYDATEGLGPRALRPRGETAAADTGPGKTRARGREIGGVKHTLGDACPSCPGEHGGPGPCDHTVYGRAYLRFVQAHAQEFRTAYFNPDKRTSRGLLQRLAREYVELPPRHVCSCTCPSEDISRGYPACPECRKQRERDQWIQQDVGAEIGRTAAVHAPMPDVLMLDIAAGYLGFRR
jgi:hypothetical protein